MSKNFATNKLKIIRNKTKIATIALVLMLTMAATLTALPVVNAHTPPISIRSFAFISAAPNPVGLGQTIFMNFFLNIPAPTVNYLAGVDVWKNLTVIITKPDHTTVTLGPFRADATGGTYTTYVADQLGEYSFVFNFPGQTLTGDPRGPAFTSNPIYIGDYFQPSSATTTLTVQQEKVEQYPDTPLPTGYWQRPIYSMNTLWSTIGGNWLGYAASNFHTTGIYNQTGNFAPYTTAPSSPHIVWTRPIKFGGQIGGEYFGTQTTQFVTTSQYQPLFAPIIIAGRLYWQERPGSSNDPTGWNCVDIRTGKLIWHKNISESLRFGEILDYESINQYGAYAYLWSSRPTVAPNTGATYGMYDAWTGEWILDVVNASLAAATGAPGLVWMVDTRTCKGSVLGLYVNASRLYMWNSTRCVLMGTRPGSGDPYSQQLNPSHGVRPFSNGIAWSAPIPTNFTGTYPSGRTIDLQISGTQMTPDITVLRYNPTFTFGPNPGWFVEAGFSSRNGQLLWGPINRTHPAYTYLRSSPAHDGVYTIVGGDTFDMSGYSMTTGAKLWGPITLPHNVWCKYGMAFQCAYGNIYEQGFGGYLNCIDAKTGQIKWTYYTGGSGYDTPYGVHVLWTFSRQAIADGKIYVGEGHEYSPPLFRGAQQLCIDAFTGKLIYSTLGFFAISVPAIADGYMVAQNAYDGQLYCFNKGQTATTVSASPKVAVNGSSTLIEGTVTDQSPGQTCFGTPAAGTPAIADAYMKPWMAYLYMQQPMPSNATGVPVQLQAVGSDGAMIDIGTVTSDAFGNFKYAFCPTKPDTYTILATFAGSNSYYASYASTGAAVDPSPPAPTPAAEPPAPTDYTPMFAGIIAAVVIVAILVLYDIVTVRKLKK
jgi:hypothetical protein